MRELDEMELQEKDDEIERLTREYECCYEACASLTGSCADRDEVIAELREALDYAIQQVPELATVPGIAAALTKEDKP